MQSKLKACAIAILVVDVIGLLLQVLVGLNPGLLTGPAAFSRMFADTDVFKVPYEAFLRSGLSILAAILAINGISKERKPVTMQYDYPVADGEGGDSDGTVAEIISVALVILVIPAANWILTTIGTVSVARLGGADEVAAYSWMRTVMDNIWLLPGWFSVALVLVCGIDLGRKKDPEVI